MKEVGNIFIHLFVYLSIILQSYFMFSVRVYYPEGIKVPLQKGLWPLSCLISTAEAPHPLTLEVSAKDRWRRNFPFLLSDSAVVSFCQMSQQTSSPQSLLLTVAVVQIMRTAVCRGSAVTLQFSYLVSAPR